MCLVGKRKLEIFLLTGPVLAVWNPVQEILNQYDKNSRIQVVRLRTADEKRLVGKLDLKKSELESTVGVPYKAI